MKLARKDKQGSQTRYRKLESVIEWFCCVFGV